MDDTELRAARDLVAASRPYRDQMREDWAYHREPEEVLDEAVGDLMAERDRLQRILADVFTALYPVPTGPGGVTEHAELPAHVAAMRVERDRLRTVVEAAQAFAAAQDAWREQAERGVKPTDDVNHRQAAATATLLHHVRQLDASKEATSG